MGIWQRFGRHGAGGAEGSCVEGKQKIVSRQLGGRAQAHRLTSCNEVTPTNSVTLWAKHIQPSTVVSSPPGLGRTRPGLIPDALYLTETSSLRGGLLDLFSSLFLHFGSGFCFLFYLSSCEDLLNIELAENGEDGGVRTGCHTQLYYRGPHP